MPLAFVGDLISGRLELYGICDRAKQAVVERFAHAAFTGSLRDRVYEQVANQVGNGRSLLDAMRDIGARQRKRYGASNPTAIALAQIVNRMQVEGKTFAEAFAGWIPAEEILLIDAGERGGDLPTVLRLALKTHERQKGMVKAVFSAMVEPLVLLLALYAMLYIIGVQVVPPLMQVLPASQWQGSAHVLYVASKFTQTCWSWLAPSIVAGAFLAIVVTFPLWTGKVRAFVDRMPPWSIYRMLQGSAWLMSFTALARAGVTHTEALEVMIRYASAWLRERLVAVRAHMLSGENLGKALESAGYGFPDPEIIDDVLAFVDFPDFDETMAAIADQWAEQGTRRIKASAAVLNIVVSGLTYAVMIYLVMGINQLQDQLSTAIGHH